MSQLYFPESAARFRACLEEIKGRSVAVLGHLRPDGDCIGSQVGLARTLKRLGARSVCCYNGHAVPPACSSFVGDTPFKVAAEGMEFSEELVITVDCADRSRIGAVLDKAFPEIYLNIDHHISNTAYARHNLIEGHASATGEVLGGIFLENGYSWDPVTAQALYVGIATDTGQFRFGSTTQMTFEICCHLMENGANPATAAMELYERESPAKLALLQRFLASFQYHCDSRVCIGILQQKDWDETKARKEDTEGLVDFARSIEGVEIGVLVEERDGLLKGSFRAKEPRHRVDMLARTFNGGGHACAAGFNPGTDLATFLPQLIAVLENHFNNIK